MTFDVGTCSKLGWSNTKIEVYRDDINGDKEVVFHMEQHVWGPGGIIVISRNLITNGKRR